VVGGVFIRGRVRSGWHGRTGSGSAISSGRASELEGTLSLVVGRDEATIRAHIRKQEQEDARLDQSNLWR